MAKCTGANIARFSQIVIVESDASDSGIRAVLPQKMSPSIGKDILGWICGVFEVTAVLADICVYD